MEVLGTTRIKVKNGMEHRDGNGNLIYAEWTRTNDMAIRYDTWRSNWCNKNRLSKTPEGFREGKITSETLQFAIILGYKPEFTIQELAAILNSEIQIMEV